MNRILNKAICFLLAAMLFTACNEKTTEPNGSVTTPTEPPTEPPVVEVDLPKGDGSIDEIGVKTLATGDVKTLNNIEFKVKVSDKAVPKECGIAYSTNLTDLKRKTAWSKKAQVTKSGEVTIKLDLLYSGATYYYAAYSIYEGSCYYGDVKSLTTPKNPVGKEINLGLSVNWADRNLEADSPTGYGNFYRWAETIPAGRTSDMYSKNQILDKSDITDTEYDVVKNTWGGRWRLPTQKEMEDLAWKCKWEIVTLEGKSVAKVTSNIDIDEPPYIYIPLCEVEYIGEDDAHGEYYPALEKDAESVYLLTGTQVEKKDWNPYVMSGDIMSWCYALSYHEIDFENKKAPSVGILNSKNSIYCVRPVYVPVIIN
ncbi:MAG: hypothetical protein SPK61_03085 [Bacteroidales bacterium]|nr:hypothetical protein [Bacteroidales bacterium]